MSQMILNVVLRSTTLVALNMLFVVACFALENIQYGGGVSPPTVGKMATCDLLCTRNLTDLPLLCQSHCGNGFKDATNILGSQNAITQPMLNCRSSGLLSVRWASTIDVPKIGNESPQYVVELIAPIVDLEGKMIEEEEVVDIIVTNKTMATFYNLTDNYSYRVRVTTYNNTGKLGPQVKSDWFRTLVDDFKPSPVPNITLHSFTVQPNNLFQAVINWEPSEDHTCFYNFIAWDTQNYFDEKEISQPENLYSKVLSDLEYSSNYTINIVALNPNNPLGKRESVKAWFSLTIPSCLETQHSLTVCVPPPPENLSVEEVIQAPTDTHPILFDVIVYWSRPELQPDYYEVMLQSLSNESIQTAQNVSGNHTMARFISANIGINYQVSVVAVSEAGSSEHSMILRRVSPDAHAHAGMKGLISLSHYSAIGFAVGGAALLSGLITLALRIRRRSVLYEKRRRYFQDLERKAPKDVDIISSINIKIHDDPMEIIPDSLVLMEVLGEGAFGVVRRVLLPNSGVEAAVKMLKDAPSAEEVKQFKAEIDMMKGVGTHPHLVSLIGCCTRPSFTMMLIVEYCEKGDLQNYLRSAWDRMSSMNLTKLDIEDIKKSSLDKKSISTMDSIPYIELQQNSFPSKEEHPNLIINKLYDIDNNIRSDLDITAIDLLSFGRQIAMGMEFLATNRIVHRDLAARNVLVCSNKTVKIADFGMSRDIYQENIYKKTGAGKLPIKWMAIEALTHQVYTTQSDVWSFGVLLWEIVTLGGNPYPSIPTSRLLKLLLAGYRMDRPLNCSEEVYQIMLSCWNMRPRDRPTFTELSQQLDSMLENISNHMYLDLNILDIKDIEEFRRIASDQPTKTGSAVKVQKVYSDRYIKPTPVRRPSSSMNLNLYSHLPINPPPYPAPTSFAGFTTSLRLSQSCNVNLPDIMCT